MLRSIQMAATLVLLVGVAGALQHKSVLILHEGSRALPYQIIASEELRTGLTAQRNLTVEVYEEFLDTWRLNQDPARLASALDIKYFGRKFDVVVADGAVALNLLLHNPPELLQTTPVVFLSVPDISVPDKLPPNVTGVATHIDYAGIVRLAARLQPDLRNVYYVQGGQGLDELNNENLRREFEPFDGKFNFTVWSRLGLSELLEKVGQLAPHSVVLFDSYMQDPEGRAHVSVEVSSAVAASANAPVYVPYETMIGKGAVAGVTVDFRSIARQANRIILALVNGGKVADFPVEQSRNVVMADWRQLRRFGFSERSLPSSTVVLDREPTMWERYRWYIVSALVILLFESGLILALALEARRRRRSEKSTRELAGKLIDAQEEERRRIARELHDDLSQRLAWTCIQLDAMRQNPPSEEMLARRLTELYEETDLISSDVHNISHELHPAVLERLGLVPALRQFCDEFSLHRKIAVHLSVSCEEVALGKEAALALFRVSQESLMNVAKHSGVTSCRLSLEQVHGRVRLTVSDRGKGFETSTLKDHGGLGLESMRERLRSVGGGLRVASNPTRGTSIRAEVPLRRQELDGRDTGADGALGPGPPKQTKNQVIGRSAAS